MRFTKNTTPLDIEIVKGDGIRLYDTEDRQYFDISGQSFNLLFGHHYGPLVESVNEQIQNVIHLSSIYKTPIAQKALDRFGDIFPLQYTVVSFKLCSGSLANEHAIKAARKKTGKNFIFSLDQSYHGQSFEAMRISGRHFDREYLSNRRSSFFPAPDCSNCPVGQDYGTCNVECLAQFDDIWSSVNGDVAAFIIEPIMIEAGVIEIPKKYFHKISELCKKKNIALIFDEVQTAGGWLGDYTYSHTLDNNYLPDIITIGKAISGGYPLAAVVLTEEFDVLEHGEHEVTYGGFLPSLASFVQCSESVLNPEFKLRVSKLSDLLESELIQLKEKYNFVLLNRGRFLIRGILIDNFNRLSRTEVINLFSSYGLLVRATLPTISTCCIQIKLSCATTHNEISEIFSKIDECFYEISNIQKLDCD